MKVTYSTTAKNPSPSGYRHVPATTFGGKVQKLWRLANNWTRLRTKILAGALVLTVVFGLTPGCGDDGSGGGKRPDASITDPECGDWPSTQVIGNWDVVPFQRLDATFNVGVVAFHELGVDVVFYINDQEVARAEEPSMNDRTGVVEYWFPLNPADYDDGEVTVTALIEPDCPGHLQRELEPLTLYANSGGTLTNEEVRWADCSTGDDDSGDGTESSPYRTIEKALTEVGSGGTVYLKAGNCYELTSLYPSAGFTHWTTVEPAPGVSREEIDILTYGQGDSTGRFGEDMVRWHLVRFHKDVEPGYSTLFYFESGHSVWFDEAELYDARGQWNGGNPVNGNSPYHVYYTDAYIHDLQNAGYGFGRNVYMENIGSDILRGSSNLTSINLTVHGIDRGTTEAHPDFFQFYNPDSTVDNVIVYNTKVYDMGAQGIFGGPGSMRNIAFVNLLMEKDPSDSALISQLTGDWDHLLLWHITTVDSGMLLREPEEMRNVFIQNCLFATMNHGDATQLQGFTIDHNHYASLTWDQTDPMGTNASVGDPLFRDVDSDDYTLQSESPAVGAGTPLPGVPADVDGSPWDPDSPSLGCFAHTP